MEFEIRSLRERNKKLEFEINRLKNDYRTTNNNMTMINKPNTLTGGISFNNTMPINNNNNVNNGPVGSNIPIDNLSDREIQKKILEEINNLKKDNITLKTPQIQNDNNIIQNNNIEINRLKNDNMKLIEENKRLKTLINETSVNDIKETNEPENPKSLKMKIKFLESTIENLEKERSELNMRCTMAEEQLKNFQEMFNTTTQGYQKKILELNKRLEAANLRLN